MSRNVLGRGLGALIPQDSAETSEPGSYRRVPLSMITPNPMQPRTAFDDEALTGLADSIKANGVIQPLVVRRNGAGYVLIAGERRYRAAGLAGLADVPAVVVDQVDDTRMLEMALVENIQREDLNPLEAADAYHRLIEECGLTQQQMAERVGKSRTAITNTLRLRSLPMPVKQMLRSGKLTEGHARNLLSLGSETAMLEMAERIVSGTLSVRQTEAATRSTTLKKRRLVPKRKAPALAEAESHLKQVLGTAVRIIPGLKTGRIEVDYYGDDDLHRILELLQRIEA